MPSNCVKYPVATRIQKDGNGNIQIVRYHNTDVVTVEHNGDVVLNSGGWRTRTTISRMNQYAPGIAVYQRKNHWYVKFQGVIWSYQDGMRLRPDGFVDYSNSGRMSGHV